MRVFILGLLAVSSVHSHAINRYPYHDQLLSFAPTRGEFPVYNGLVQGYVRYLDSNGAERLIGYNYPEPLFGVRRYNYEYGSNQGNQNLRTYIAPETGFSAQSYYQAGDTTELAKVREEHFRRWCEQRYQALKTEVEKLRAEGLKPSKDMMAQLEPLEKIISSTTYTAIGVTPEIQRIRDEHLRIWNEARLKVLQQEASHLRFSQATKDTSQIGFSEFNANQNAIIGETAEQKQAREEHLRIYNEQLALVKKLEAEQKMQQDTIKVQQPAQTYGTYQEVPNLALKTSFQETTQQQTAQIADTPEVIKAREEHLRLVNEAKLRAQSEGNYNTHDDGSYKAEYQAESSYKGDGKIEQTPVLRIIPALQQPIQPIQNIAILQTAQPINQGIQQQQSSILKTTTSDFQSQQQPAPVQDTPEVIRAREEHLRLVNEAKLKAVQSQQELKPFGAIDAALAQQGNQAQVYGAPIDDAEKIREEERIREEQRLLEAERLREAERMRDEEKMRELERLREIERQKEEEKTLEFERIRLMEEEAKRKEIERLDEEKRLKTEQEQRILMEQGTSSSGIISGGSITGDLLSTQLQTQQDLKLKSQQGYVSGSSTGYIAGSSTSGGIITGSGPGSGFVLSSQYKNNPYLIRFASQPGTTAYIIGEQQQQQAAIKPEATFPNLYYLPSQKEGPLYLRYTHNGIKSPNAIQQLATASLTGGSSEKYSTYSSSSSSSSGSSSSSDLKVSYGVAADSTATGLSELEKATREHFRAHELALEQLRVANAKTPYTKDC